MIANQNKKTINRNAIRNYRRDHLITQAVFASRLGMALAVYARTEGGYRQFTEAEIAELIRQTGMTYEQLTA